MPAHFFSIIIPVYNDNKNLPRCLDSVLSQTSSDFELLLIDDGSTDNCPAICDEYAKKDSRIRVCHKENEGISRTRQYGLNNASGDYIYFVDSDDWIEPNFIDDFINYLKNEKADLILMDFFKETVAGNKRTISQKPSALDTETITHLVLERKLLSCLWNVAINRSFYTKNDIRFIEGINYGEDTLFILELLLNNPKVAYLAKAYYHHTYNHNSFTRKDKKQRFIERVRFLDKIVFLLNKYNKNVLEKHNFFPFIDKYEMLSSNVFSKKEYQELYPLSFTPYYRKQSDFYKYFLLALAETKLYSLAKLAAAALLQIKNWLY
ncbi:MAG: glycosyltransferase [Treponema sp.]|jgi:glycosyltransferase involved in cell wall biosynthesis|nr:glycosyltransferase [Treponema sp.]